MATNFGKGLSVIQEELHRMRMATKAQVDSIAIQKEVSPQGNVASVEGFINVCVAEKNTEFKSN